MVILYLTKVLIIKRAKKTAYIVANTIRIGLNSDMLNGIMVTRDFTLKEVEYVKGIQDVYIIRGEAIDKQFRPAFKNENPRDAIDYKVLKTGKPIYVFDENLKNASFRITIIFSKMEISIFELFNGDFSDSSGAFSVLNDVNLKDEIGNIVSSYRNLANVLKTIFAELFNLAKSLSQGDLDELSKSLKTSVDSFNKIAEHIDSFEGDIKDIAENISLQNEEINAISSMMVVKSIVDSSKQFINRFQL
ncbi:MAG: hypothetical protein ACP5UF_01260 [Hydrogenobaculum sp.]